MFFGTKLIKYQVSFGDPLNLWGFYSLTAPHYGKGSSWNIPVSIKLINFISFNQYLDALRRKDNISKLGILHLTTF